MNDFPSRNLDKIVIRVPDGLRDRIAREAKDNGRSVNAELVRLLEAHYPKPPSLKDIETELLILTRTIKNPISRFDMSKTLSLISQLKDKIAEMSPQKGDEP